MQVSHMFDMAQASTGSKMGAPTSLTLTPKTGGGLRSFNSTQVGPTETVGYNTSHKKPRSAALWSQWQEMYEHRLRWTLLGAVHMIPTSIGN